MSETPQVDIVVPVKNEERDLAPGVTRLVGYLRDAFPFSARITIADNGSTDGTWSEACALEEKFPEVRAVHLALPGRGRALHQVWSSSDAAVVAYMDVDLSTDLNALPPLVAPLLPGHSDVAIGTRLARGSRVVRGPKREIISRCYNLLLRLTLRVGFSDAQCGFKAVRACPARELLPLAEFEAMVAKGEVHYYVGESNNSFGGGSGSSSIASWVAAHFKSQTVGGTTVYNLTQAK